MRIFQLLRRSTDDASDDPQHWSDAKLASECERVQAWLVSETLSERERAAVERVMLRISKAASARWWRRKALHPHDPTTISGQP